LIGLFAGCASGACAADATTVTSLNNDGVNALKVNNYAVAIEKFKAALKLDPDSQLARDNLAIAHNNYGLQLRNDPKAALKQFHEALYLNRSNPTTLVDVEGIIKIMGKDPHRFKDRVELGDQARQPANADFIGAIIEYSEALKIKDDPAIHAKLGDVYLLRDENDKAIAEYQAAAKLADGADIEVELGQAFQAKKDIPDAQTRKQYDQALNEYQLAAKADPHNDISADTPSGPSQSPEAQRFEAAKLMRQRQLAYTYVRTAKSTVDKAWQESHPPASGKLLITKVKITLDTSGKMSDYKVLAGSGSEQEDKSVRECVNSLAFAPLRTGTVDLFLTFMSDGSMNMVEFSDSREASTYYGNLLGANMQPNGSVIMRPVRAGPDIDFGPYMADLQRRIKKAWLPPKGNESKRVVVVFKVHRDGALSNLRIDHSSGVACADQAALKV
jgi:tetratricopeptide (TPR) repeat protein